MTFSRLHGLEQGDGRLGINAMAWDLSEAARVRLPDRRIGLPRILDGEAGEDLGEPLAEIACLIAQRRRGEGGGEQDDAEIGVVADGGDGRRDACADAFPDRGAGLSDEAPQQRARLSRSR